MSDRLRAIVALCLAVALVWQGYLTQTHAHDAPIPRAALVAGASAPTVLAERGRADVPATCPICLEAAFSGHYLATGPIGFTPPAMAPAWFGPAEARIASRGARSHNWRSRAPPAPSTLPTA